MNRSLPTSYKGVFKESLSEEMSASQVETWMRLTTFQVLLRTLTHFLFSVLP